MLRGSYVPNLVKIGPKLGSQFYPYDGKNAFWCKYDVIGAGCFLVNNFIMCNILNENIIFLRSEGYILLISGKFL